MTGPNWTDDPGLRAAITAAYGEAPLPKTITAAEKFAGPVAQCRAGLEHESGHAVDLMKSSPTHRLRQPGQQHRPTPFAA